MTQTEIKKLQNSQVEITGEIAPEVFEKYRDKATRALSEKVDIPGFRKGHVPANVLEKTFGETAILEEMAEYALSETYPKILRDNEIHALGRPEVTITKMAKGNPLGFKITTAVMPELTLPDYAAAAKKALAKEESVTVEDKEVEDVLTEIRKQKASREAPEKKENGGASPEEGADAPAKDTEQKQEELPELTDEFARSLGDFKDVTDLKQKIRENLQKEKEGQAKEKKRGEILEEILTHTKRELPEVLIEGELDRMTAQLKSDVSGMGLTFEDYLTHLKKTEEELRTAWRADAEKKATAQLIMNKIAIAENITPDPKKVEEQTKHLIEHYPDADPERTRAYVEMVATNEAVMEYLEKQK